jgi:hypothetical protein
MKIAFTRQIPGKPPVSITIETPGEDMPLLDVWQQLIIPVLKAAGFSDQALANLHDKD